MTWKQDKQKLERFISVYDYRRIKLAEEQQQKKPDKIKLRQHNSVSNVALRQAVKLAEKIKQNLSNPAYYENNKNIKNELMKLLTETKAIKSVHLQREGRAKIKQVRKTKRISLKRLREIRKIKKEHGLFPFSSAKKKKPIKRTHIIVRLK